LHWQIGGESRRMNFTKFRPLMRGPTITRHFNFNPWSRGHISAMTGEKKPINLLRGWPSPHLLPPELLSAAASKALADPSVWQPGLEYAPDPGYEPLRKELARFLSKHYRTTPDPERICISGGASQSVACILQSFTDPVYTRAVWAIAPCYF